MAVTTRTMLTAKSELRGLELSRLMDINRGARQTHQLNLEGAKTHIKPFSLTPPCGLTGSTAKMTSQHLVLSPHSLLVPWWHFIPTAKPCSISLHRASELRQHHVEENQTTQSLRSSQGPLHSGNRCSQRLYHVQLVTQLRLYFFLYS